MSDNTKAEVITTTVKFPHRSSRGILLGLTATEVV